MTQPSAFDALMHEICVELGWCGSSVGDQPLHIDDLIPEGGPVTADQFVGWVFRADGIDPDAEPDKSQTHRNQLREAFARHMGSEIVDAGRLKWDVG